MKVYVKNSAQHGRGVFAGTPLCAGEEIIKFTGPLLHRAQLNPDDYHLQIDDELYLGPSGQPDDYVNHCCAPNAAFGDGLSLIALRDIAAHEEITWDYSTAIDEADFAGFPCCCGAPACRKIVASFRHLNAADQQRLAPYALPYLKAKLGPGRQTSTG
ncbi:MAG TPA: SET domain-containing protein-lysine N-methyltransferase [Gammaproteobacteria bacterium]|nr:SET domain-containing protein-lysine N-methyltransferase [Gammaproteobacteria bacterium]